MIVAHMVFCTKTTSFYKVSIVRSGQLMKKKIRRDKFMTGRSLVLSLVIAMDNRGLKFKTWLGILLPFFLGSQNYFKHESNKKFH